MDKIVRCFHAQANNKKIDLMLLGASFGAARGPDVFELIPFAPVENVIKYSPVGQTVSVKIHETSTTLHVTVISVGPKIEADEFEKIFSKNYRGRNATETGSIGTGIGLFNARMLVADHFGGRIWANQESTKFQMGLVEYATTTFHVEIPRSV